MYCNLSFRIMYIHNQEYLCLKPPVWRVLTIWLTIAELNLQVLELYQDNDQATETQETGTSSITTVACSTTLKPRHFKENLQKPFKCEQCGAGFTRGSSVRRHQVTCGKRKFECTICKREFANYQAMIKHTCLALTVPVPGSDWCADSEISSLQQWGQN